MNASPKPERSSGAARTPIRSLMAREAACGDALEILESCSLAQAAEMMAKARVLRSTVVSEKGLVVGVLMALDILRWLEQQTASGRWR